MQFQQNVNRNMVEHLNMTVQNQNLQSQALGQLVENTRQREFDKLFDSIPNLRWGRSGKVRAVVK